MNHLLHQRRDQRVDYEATIRLFPPEAEDPVVGRTANISLSGAFVAAPEVLDVGTEIVCDLALPPTAAREDLTVRGRVAWVYEPQEGPGGMGIAFHPLSEPDVSLLSAVTGPAQQDARPLVVWFEGVDQPVRVEALSAPDGMRLRTSLPFLRLGSRVCFDDAETGLVSEQCVLDAVELVIDPVRGVPCIELKVAPELVDTAPLALEQDGQPDQPIDELGYTLAEADDAEPARTDRDLEGQLCAKGATDQRPGSEREPEVSELARGLDTRTWLWLAGLALCGGTALWTMHTGFWAEVSDRLEQPGTEVHASKAAATPARVAGSPAAAPARVAGSPAAAPRTRTRAASRGPTDGALERRDSVSVQRFGRASVLVVPIRGSIEGSSSYALTRPPGVVIKLPAAEARVPLADYRVNDGGFGVVWVRRGEPSGLHLRFHFRAKELQHTIALAEDRVALTLSPTP